MALFQCIAKNGVLLLISFKCLSLGFNRVALSVCLLTQLATQQCYSIKKELLIPEDVL